MTQTAQDILQSVFGYDEFRLNQADIIDSVITGNDTFALMPTGGGKSLCYQIPALALNGVGIVISPLIALMQDQVSALQQLGIKAAYLNSTLDAFSAREIEQRLLDHQLDLLYISPERLMMGRMLSLLDRSQVALFAIDEAHCVSQWGHNFRSDYRQLSVLNERFPGVPRIALTATADARTREDIISELQLHEANCFTNSFDRPNIYYSIHEGQNAREQLLRFIQNSHAAHAGIVYCLSRKKVEATAEWLTKKGLSALPYHAGLPADLRAHHQERFLREDGIIIVATIAFGMGIDKPDVRFVAHLNLPKSLESYYQETGRAGRDGQPADTWMAYNLQDVITLRQMVQESQANDQYKQIEHHKLEAMLGLCELTDCRRQAILSYFGEHRAEPCGNCDNCLIPPETRDGTDDARKALSCVYRTSQRFGVNYVIDVLRGKADNRIQSNGHDQLTTFGIGEHLSQAQWKQIFRQLIAQGFAYVDMARHGAVRLSDTCRPLLRGEASIQLRSWKEPTKASSLIKKGQDITLADTPLWEALRECRTRLAKEQGVPPYVIFHDTTLLQMLEKRPTDNNSLQYISGVGERKLEKYGNAFIKVIKQYPRDKWSSSALNDTVNDTLHLLGRGQTSTQIAQQRGLTDSTIFAHLATAIEHGIISIHDAISLEEHELEQIERAFEVNALEGKAKLSDVYSSLDETHDYGILKCVQAHLQWQ